MNTNSHKNKYVAKAVNILEQEGFGLSLDEVANKVGITRKTLYNNFSSRDGFLKECVHAISGNFQNVLSILEEGTGSPIESLTKCFTQLDGLFITLNPAFFSNLIRSNPDQATLGHLTESRYFRRTMTTNLQRGIQRDLYRSGLGIPFVCEYISYSIFGSYIQAVIRDQPLPTGGYFTSILRYRLQAIVSVEGNHFI